MKRLVIVLLVLLCAAGCSSTNSSEEQSNVLSVGMECDYAPFNWTQSADSDTAVPMSSVDYADGYDVIIATKIRSFYELSLFST